LKEYEKGPGNRAFFITDVPDEFYSSASQELAAFKVHPMKKGPCGPIFMLAGGD
jgi:hypothetical protein